MYLPLAGIAGAIATAALMWLPLTTARARRVTFAAALAIAAGLSAVTVARNVDYQDGIRVWQTVIDRRPHPRAHEHISEHLRDAGRIDEAIEHLRVAAPDSPTAKHALAAFLLERGQIDEAMRLFDEFIRDNPQDRDINLARREYASALRKAGRTRDAITQLEVAAAAAPADVRSSVDLADALKATGDLNGAIAEYRRSRILHPDNVVVLSNLGVTLADAGMTKESMGALRAALAIDDRLIGPRLRLAQLLILTGDHAGGEKEARAVIAVDPGNADGHNLLGVALASQQQLEPARAAFADALRLQPQHAEARRNLGLAEQRLQGKARE